MQQLTQKPGFDERHEAPVLLSSGIPGIRLGLRDVLKPEIEVIRQITTHGVHEITIVRDHSGRIVKETSVPKSDTAAFFDTRHISGFTFTEVVLKSRIIPTNKAGAKVITYTYLDDTELVKSAIERKYISDESSGNLSSTIETVNTYTPDGQIDTIKVQFIGATTDKKTMVKSSSVLTRTDRGQPIAFRIDTANSDGTIKSVRKVRDYDIKGNIVSETDYVWNDNGEALSAQLSRSEMQYDDTGHIIEVKITEGEETRFYKYSYESLGDGRTVVTRKSFTGELEEISERLEFDKNGKQISYSTRLAPDAKEIATKWKKVSE